MCYAIVLYFSSLTKPLSHKSSCIFFLALFSLQVVLMSSSPPHPNFSNLFITALILVKTFTLPSDPPTSDAEYLPSPILSPIIFLRLLYTKNILWIDNLDAQHKVREFLPSELNRIFFKVLLSCLDRLKREVREGFHPLKCRHC